MRRREFIAVVAGATAGWPLAARAQQNATPVIGILGNTKRERISGSYWAAFLQALREADFVEGQNLTIEIRAAEGNYDRLPSLAADLVGHKVDVIVATSDPAARAAKNATSTIPVVFIAGGDPVDQGLVASLARPGGNLTGVSFLIIDLIIKR